MINNKLVERAARSVELERMWVKEAMQEDALFGRLANTQRNRVHLGRMFVAWTIVDDAPLIDTLFKVEDISIGERGLRVMVATASAVRDLGILRIDHSPKKVHNLDLYFWIPNHSEVRYAPADPGNPKSQFFTSLPLLVRFQHPPEMSQVPGRLYFAPKNEFAAIWPSHNF